MSIFSQWKRKLFGPEKRARMAEETDQTFLIGGQGAGEQRDRYVYDREAVLRQALDAWRANPLARRIVELTTQYVVGGGIAIRAGQAAAHDFLDAWWRHPLNQMPVRVYEWCDELARSGELFLLLSTDPGGMSYVRAIPAGEIESIACAENDAQQEIGFYQKAENPGDPPRRWAAYNQTGGGGAGLSLTPRFAAGGGPSPLPGGEGNDLLEASAIEFPTVMLHYAINRPVGAVRGESDLAPLLKWLGRYAAWLEDRARLNRYRNSFVYVVRSRFQSEGERLARQQALTAVPPTPGSILVVDEGEEWSVIAPELGSHEAGEDGLALKKMIAAGAGLPLHFLAEPESATRTTAEAAGGPTYRHFEQRQQFFTWLVSDLARAVLRRRALVDWHIDPECTVQVSGADLSARDNAALAVAMSTAAGALTTLRDRGLIDDAELLRLVYRFAGEVPDVEDLLERGKQAAPDQRAGDTAERAPIRTSRPLKNGRPSGIKIDPVTGEVRGTAEI